MRLEQRNPETNPMTDLNLFGEPEKKSFLPAVDFHSKFLEFWGYFPKRVGSNPKFGAEQKFEKAVKSGENAETIIAGARRFAAECLRNKTDARFVPMAVTWLNQKRWRDDPDVLAGQEPSGPKSFLETARELREYAARNNADGEHAPDHR